MSYNVRSQLHYSFRTIPWATISLFQAQWRRTSINAYENVLKILFFQSCHRHRFGVRPKKDIAPGGNSSGTYSPKSFEYLPPHRRVQASGGAPALSPVNRMASPLSSARSRSSTWLCRGCIRATNSRAPSRNSPPSRKDLVIKSSRSSCVSAFTISRARFRPPCAMVPRCHLESVAPRLALYTPGLFEYSSCVRPLFWSLHISHYVFFYPIRHLFILNARV